VLFPVLVTLACTKTERTEPVGYAVSFSVPEADDAARLEIENLVGGLQTVVSPDQQKRGCLSYTCFIPAQNSRSADAFINGLKGLKGVVGLTTMPVNARDESSVKIYRCSFAIKPLMPNPMWL
jgi:hypothetical protein